MAYDHSELEGLRYLLSQCAALHVQMPTVIERCDDREMTRTVRFIQYDMAVRALIEALATVAYKDGFFAWKWSDGYMNPYPISAPQNWRVIDKSEPQ